MKRVFALSFLAAAVVSVASAQEFCNVEYLCTDWGPAMKLPTKPGEKPQFSASEEEVYFLKQVGRFTRGLTGEHGKGINIYLCKMKPDGSEKTEIRELWHNPNPIDTQGQSTWMDISEKTRKIALAITYAGSDITGLWTIKLDGSELQRIIKPEQNEKHLQAINHPSWTPDGRWILFEEQLRGMNPNRFNLARCDVAGANFVRVIEATATSQYVQPAVSPDGKQVAFTKYPNGYPGARYVWLMNIDGTNAHALLDAKSQPTWGNYPTWSPDGKRILLSGATGTIVDGITGQVVLLGQPRTDGKAYTFG